MSYISFAFHVVRLGLPPKHTLRAHSLESGAAVARESGYPGAGSARGDRTVSNRCVSALCLTLARAAPANARASTVHTKHDAPMPPVTSYARHTESS